MPQAPRHSAPSIWNWPSAVRPPSFTPEALLEVTDQRPGAPDVAGEVGAHLQGVLRLRRVAEHGVEAQHLVHVRMGDVELLDHQVDAAGRDPAELVLITHRQGINALALVG